MTNTELITALFGIWSDYMAYFLPVIGAVSGLMFLTSWIWAVTFKAAGQAGRSIV